MYIRYIFVHINWCNNTQFYQADIREESLRRIFRSQQASASLARMIWLYIKMATSETCATNDRGLIEREKRRAHRRPPHPCSLKEGVHRAGQKIISSTKIPRKDGDPIKKGCRRMPRTVWAFILRRAAGNNSSQKFPSRRENAIHVTAVSVPTVVLFINGRLFCFSTVFPRSLLYLSNGLFLTWDEEQPWAAAAATLTNNANENYHVFFPAKWIPANSGTKHFPKYVEHDETSLHDQCLSIFVLLICDADVKSSRADMCLIRHN